MRKAGVGPSVEAKAWKVLSSALSWAVEDDSWPLLTNGCLTMQRRRGVRRASRRAGTGATRQVSPGKRRDDLASRALSPLAVERIRLVMLERSAQRSPLLALRDATAVSVQSGRGMPNQEIWALTLGDVAGLRATVREVLRYGALDAGKTEGATGPSRRPPIDALLADDLTAWKAALAAHGYPTATDDFLLRGDLGGHGAPDGHMTGSQAHKWPVKYFAPAGRKVAEEWPDEHGDIVGATPYSLRRGLISLRIRAGEDRQPTAKQCGTSVEMRERSYSFAIEDLEDEGPKPADEERLRADSSHSPVSVVSSGLLERDAGDRRRESCLAQRAPRASATLGRSSDRPRFCCPRAARNRAGDAEHPGSPCERRRSSAGRALHS
jgi:hypothetical protein